MKAELYLLNESFYYQNANLSLLEESIMQLSEDFDYIKKQGDKILKHSSIYEVDLPNGYKFFDLYDDTKNIPISKDVKKQLLKLIDHSNETSWTNNEVKELITNQLKDDLCQEKQVYGLLALLELPQNIDDVFIIHNQRNWFEFHRFFLANYPCEEQYFVNECGKVFPKTFLHPNVIDSLPTMDGGWKNFSYSIVKCLSALNDKFPKYISNRKNYQRIDILKEFSAECGYEVTPQGNAKDKPNMTFRFNNVEGKNEEICCEPHMKLSKSDNDGDTFYFNRIYFHEGNEKTEKGKILVGHIGKHL